VYRLLRERAPVWRSPPGIWVLTRYADIIAVVKDPRFGYDFEGRLSSPHQRSPLLGEPVYRLIGLSMLVRNPPDHTRLRGLVAKAFTARRIEAMRSRIEATVDALLDAIIPRRHMDVMHDFARMLPVIVICDVLGIPEQDRPRFISGHRSWARMLDPTPKTAEEIAEENVNALNLRAYFEEIFQRREREPGDDIISMLLRARADESGGLSHDELVSNLALLFDAGRATTTYAVGNGLLALHRYPSQWEMLKAQPQLAANAVEELLRFDSPVQLTTRTAF
jgi:cytochrome P450